jgi:hypothetical protein
MLSIIKITTATVCVVAVNGRRVGPGLRDGADDASAVTTVATKQQRPTEEEQYRKEVLAFSQTLERFHEQYNACDPFNWNVECMDKPGPWAFAFVLKNLDETFQKLRMNYAGEAAQKHFLPVLKARRDAYQSKGLEYKDLDFTDADAWYALVHKPEDVLGLISKAGLSQFSVSREEEEKAARNLAEHFQCTFCEADIDAQGPQGPRPVEDLPTEQLTEAEWNKLPVHEQVRRFNAECDAARASWNQFELIHQ